MSSFQFPARELREALRSCLPDEAVQFGAEPPEVRYLCLPLSHARALSPDAMLVVGARGTGKSLWWAALQSDAHRRAVERGLPTAGIRAATEVGPGFGAAPSPDYPDKATIFRLLRDHPAEPIWRTVVARQALGRSGIPGDTWAERVAWLAGNPEVVATALRRADEKLRGEGRTRLVLFDSLDLAGDDWDTMLTLLRGLLRTLLELRAFRAIRAKAFVRHDMLADPRALAFPDASKVEANRVELTWPRHDLYNLLWQRLANAPAYADLFRSDSEREMRLDWQNGEGIWILPQALRHDEELQRRVFHALTGDWMGRDQRRGYPYTWLVNHLGDAHGAASPRSFLAALRAAAMDRERPDQSWALHYESIKLGVQEASKIRVREVTEDYPWVAEAVAPLESLLVPCAFEDVVQRWAQDETIDRLRAAGGQVAGRLPPARLPRGAEGLRDELALLGVLQPMRGDRINMPDVYRVGFRLKRRGGVKPVQ